MPYTSVRSARLISHRSEDGERRPASRSKSFELSRTLLEALTQAERPLSAYDLVNFLSAHRRVAPVQVYRALDLLHRDGLVHRVQSISAYVACRCEGRHESGVLLLICTSCGSVEKTSPKTALKAVTSAVELNGFQAAGPTLELNGRCRECSGGEYL